MVWLRVAASLLLGSLATSDGTGCQKKLNQLCPSWQTEPEERCAACVEAHLGELKPCTEEKAKQKCSLPKPTPVPLPPAPPTPPLTPTKGAPRPHLVLFVVDDQGWANVGYHNELVRTPHMDELAHGGLVLDRHYVYRWCAPTRAAFMTGREPHHVLEKTNYVTPGMTMLPRRLQQVGYVTHQVGKWHLGMFENWMTPHERGFNTSFGYLAGSEDHFTQVQKEEYGCSGVDLWSTDKPAVGRNGTYGEYLFDAEVQRIVKNHDATRPLFLYVALQSMHAPQQVPKKYSDLYADSSDDFAIMNGMASAADDVLGHTVAALQKQGLWDNTLLLLTTDNGGPAGQAASGHSGNNFPLRGGKTNLFEGGVRVNAALGGGFLPKAVRGTSLDGYAHASDWFPTFAGLAGAPKDDPNPGAAEVPDVDGFDLWPYLSGSAKRSPRTEIMLSSEDAGAIISGEFKLIMGVQTYGFWQAPNYPNASTDHSTEKEVDCGEGCLFNIVQDPSEYVDLAKTHPARLAELQKLWRERNATKYWPQKIPQDAARCAAFVDAHGGFLGPYLSWNASGTLIV